MTPEERFTKMENFMQTMMEHQAGQQQHIDKHTEQIERLSSESDKNNAAIRNLIVASRTVLSSINGLSTSIQQLKEVQRKDREEWTARMKELSEKEAATGEKLHILIDTVDRIIRNRNGKK